MTAVAINGSVCRSDVVMRVNTSRRLQEVVGALLVCTSCSSEISPYKHTHTLSLSHTHTCACTRTALICSE